MYVCMCVYVCMYVCLCVYVCVCMYNMMYLLFVIDTDTQKSTFFDGISIEITHAQLIVGSFYFPTEKYIQSN